MPYIGNNQLPFDPTRSLPSQRDVERFSGNGSTTTFTLSRAVNAAVDIEVFVENVQQEPIVAYDVIGNSLSFTGAPPSGTNNIYVNYRAYNTGAQVTVPDGSITYNKLANNIRIFTTDNLTPNGNNSVFTLSEPPADANTVMVTVDGVMQRAPVHYTTSGSTITFTSSPPAGANVHVRHLGFRTTTTVTQLSANSTISNPVITGTVTGGSSLDSVARIGVGVTSNTSYGIFNRYFGNSEIATQYGTGLIAGVGAYASNGGLFIDNGTTKTYPLLVDGNGIVSANSGFGSTGTAYFCRAWVNFNGTGTVAISKSGNVSSITDRATGQYHINFTTAMPDANYSVNGSVIGSPDSWSGVTLCGANNSDTATYGIKTTGVSVILTDLYQPNGYPQRDMSVVSVHIFR